jgi:hypothetical protein
MIRPIVPIAAIPALGQGHPQMTAHDAPERRGEGRRPRPGPGRRRDDTPHVRPQAGFCAQAAGQSLGAHDPAGGYGAARTFAMPMGRLVDDRA